MFNGLMHWASKRLDAYREPQRDRRYEGEVVPFSKQKYECVLQCLFNHGLKEIARKVDVSYKTLTQWVGEERFQRGIKAHQRKFAAYFYGQFKALFEAPERLPMEALLKELSSWSADTRLEMASFVRAGLRIDSKPFVESIAEIAVCETLLNYITTSFGMTGEVNKTASAALAAQIGLARSLLNHARPELRKLAEARLDSVIDKLMDMARGDKKSKRRESEIPAFPRA